MKNADKNKLFNNLQCDTALDRLDSWLKEWMNFNAKNNTVRQSNIIFLLTYMYNTMAFFCNRQTLKEPRLHLIEAAQIQYNLLMPDNR